MIPLAQARAKAREHLAARLREWATLAPGDGAAEPGSEGTHRQFWSIALHPPSESAVRQNEEAAEAWAREWTTAMLPDGAHLATAVRAWRSIGRQTVPVRVEFAAAEAVAAFVGGSSAREFRLLRARAEQAVAMLGSDKEDVVEGGLLAVVRRQGGAVLALPAEEWERVIAVARWLSLHSVSGLRPRSLPIRGVDSKWFSAHRTLVTALVTAVSGHHDLGVVDSDPLIRVRALDAGLAPGGVADFAAPLAQLGTLAVVARAVLVVENKETLLALPEFPGVVAVHGGGFAIDGVVELPWVREAPLLYWGDLDAAGLAILNRVRAHRPDATTVLMDADTLMAHRDLWVRDPKASRARLPLLTPGEQRLYALLREQGDVRLEQERIPLAVALEELTRVLGVIAAESR